jgi:transcriptional regulator with XRE-family HTH domain
VRPPKDEPGEVGRLLDGFRHRHPLRISQEQLALMLGVSGSTVSAWKYARSMLQADDEAVIVAKTDIEAEALHAAIQADLPRVLEHLAARRSTKHPPGARR